MTSDEKQTLMSLLTYHDRWREQLLVNIRDGVDASDLMWKAEVYLNNVKEFYYVLERTAEDE